MVEIKERLRDLVNSEGIKQQDICEKTGIPSSTMSMYFSGDRLPKQDKISLICDSFGINETWLMGYDTPKYKVDVLLERYTDEEARKLNQLKRLTCYYETFMKYSKLESQYREIVDNMIEKFSAMSKGENDEH